MASFFSCGFMRTAVLSNLRKYHLSKKEKRYAEFSAQFPDAFDVPEHYFNRKTQELSQFLRKNKWNTDIKQQYMEFF